VKSRRDRPIEHILLVAYLYSPCNVVSVHRPLGLRRAFESAGVRTTVLTSKISGSADDDEAQRVIRAGDLRTRFQTQYQTLVGYGEAEAAVDARTKPRWWTKYVVPDITALTWFPRACMRLLGLIRRDRPDVIVTTSGPESSHLLGLVARGFGVRWVRSIARRATVVTAINEEIASDVRRRYGVSAYVISNGFDKAAIAEAADERETLDPKRFSLVYTGMFAIDLEERVLHRGKDSRTFVEALELLLEQEPGLKERFELLVAGTISSAEREFLTRGDLAEVVRVLGQVPYARALGLQQAADGLLLIPGGAAATTAKVFEYLAARKPIFAITEQRSAAAELLVEAGPHTIASPDSPASLARALRAYVTRWTEQGARYEPLPDFDLDAYEYENLGRRMLELVAAADALERRKVHGFGRRKDRS
jgi:hypothetical protein